jgi:hypothetical protein
VPPMTVQSELLTEIEAFLATRKIAATTFGRMAVNDGKFVGRLRADANMTFATVERVRTFMRNYQEAENGASPPVKAA